MKRISPRPADGGGRSNSRLLISDHYGWSSVVILVLSLLVLRILVLASEPWPLYGDEAQYWLWGQSFEFGYFSKPPMIAWVIRLTTLVLGDREFGVRLAAPLFQAGTALVLYAAAREWFRGEPRASLIAHRSAMVYSLIPGVMVSSLVISTDSPLLFFWSLALFFCVRARRTNLWLDWLGLGGAIGLGLLSKYSMGLFVVSLLVVAGWVRREDSEDSNHLRLRNLRLWTGLVLGLALYSPNLVWNLTHQLVSFRHTASNAGTIGLVLYPGHVGEFLLGQMAIFGPITFVLLCILWAQGWRWRRGTVRSDSPQLARERIRFLTIFIAPPLIFASVIALLNRANINWAASSYSAAAIWLGWYFAVEFKDRGLFAAARLRYWLWVLVVVSHSLTGLTAVYYREILSGLGIELTRHNDPIVRLGPGERLGDAVLARLVEEAKNTGTFPILATDDRMIFSTLAFYIRPRVTQVQYQSGPRPTDQFQMTNPMNAYPMAPMIFVARPEVLSDIKSAEQLEKPEVLGRFQRAEAVGAITIPLHADYILYYRLYRLQNYLGN